MKPCTPKELLAKLKLTDTFCEYIPDEVDRYTCGTRESNKGMYRNKDSNIVWAVMPLPYTLSPSMPTQKYGAAIEIISPVLIHIKEKEKKIEIRDDRFTSYVYFNKHKTIDTLAEAVVTSIRKGHKIEEIF